MIVAELGVRFVVVLVTSHPEEKQRMQEVEEQLVTDVKAIMLDRGGHRGAHRLPDFREGPQKDRVTKSISPEAGA